MDFHLYKGTWVNTKAPHLYNKLSDAECKALLKRGGFIVRNTYHFDLPRESSFGLLLKIPSVEWTNYRRKQEIKLEELLIPLISKL